MNYCPNLIRLLKHICPLLLCSFYNNLENVRRLANEFVFSLCDNDEDVLVQRAGFGNAIGFLSTKMKK